MVGMALRPLSHLTAWIVWHAARVSLLEDLDNQYKLTYARPKTLIPPDTLEVTSKRPGITVRARRVP